MDERLRLAAERLFLRGKEAGTNWLNQARTALAINDMKSYNDASARSLEREQEALAEFFAAATGKCVCGLDVSYPTSEELNDGSGKACCRSCSCGRKFVMG